MRFRKIVPGILGMMLSSVAVAGEATTSDFYPGCEIDESRYLLGIVNTIEDGMINVDSDYGVKNIRVLGCDASLVKNVIAENDTVEVYLFDDDNGLGMKEQNITDDSFNILPGQILSVNDECVYLRE